MPNCAIVNGKCPKTGDPEAPRYCPMWWETVQENVATGEVKVDRSCGFRQLPAYLVEVIKASNRPAAAVESTRNALVKTLGEGFAILASPALGDTFRQRLEARLEDQPGDRPKPAALAPPAANGAADHD